MKWYQWLVAIRADGSGVERLIDEGDWNDNPTIENYFVSGFESYEDLGRVRVEPENSQDCLPMNWNYRIGG